MTLEELLANFTRGAGMVGDAAYEAIPSREQLASLIPSEQDVYNGIFDASVAPAVGAYELLSRVGSGFKNAASRYADAPISPPLTEAPSSAPGGADLESMLADFNQKLKSGGISRGSHKTAEGKDSLDFFVGGDARYQPSRGSFSKVKMTYAGDRDLAAQMAAKQMLAQIMNSGKQATAQSNVLAAALKALTAGVGDPKQNLAAILTLLQGAGRR